jgi:minor extracellular serine protease Vpr
VKVKVWMDYLPSAVVTVPLNQYAPGFFEVSGLVAAQDAAFNLITRERPARRGQVVQLYVNGLGPVTNRPASGEPTGTTGFSTTLVPPTVTIGGREAQAIFSGLTPGVVGLYQVNAIVAADTPTGDQPIIVSIGGVSSKASVIPVQ